jgi:hypothetical protein
MKLSSLGTSYRILSQYKSGCARTPVCEHPFAYPHYCEISNLPHVASVAITADLLKGMILQQCHPMQRTPFASVIAAVALGTSRLCNLRSSLCDVRLTLPYYYSFGLLKQGLEGCWFHSNEDVQMAITEWLQMQKPTFWCNRILILGPGWDTDVNMLRDYVEK